MRVLSSDKKRIYNVTESSCDCPDYTFRHAKSGSHCKHITKLFYTFEPDNEVEFKEEFRQSFKDGISFNEAYTSYGDKIDKWLKMSLICESRHSGKRMFYLLE